MGAYMVSASDIDTILDCLLQSGGERFAELADKRKWKRGALIASHHEPSRQVVLLSSGFAGRIIYGKYGREAALPMIRGDANGLDWLGPVQLPCDIKAYTDCEAFHINPDALLNLVASFDRGSIERIVAAYVQQNNRLLEFAAGLLGGTVERRLEQVMNLVQSSDQGNSGSRRSLRHSDLAELVGASRPHLSVTLGKMARAAKPEPAKKTG